MKYYNVKKLNSITFVDSSKPMLEVARKAFKGASSPRNACNSSDDDYRASPGKMARAQGAIHCPRRRRAYTFTFR